MDCLPPLPASTCRDTLTTSIIVVFFLFTSCGLCMIPLSSKRCSLPLILLELRRLFQQLWGNPRKKNLNAFRRLTTFCMFSFMPRCRSLSLFLATFPTYFQSESFSASCLCEKPFLCFLILFPFLLTGFEYFPPTPFSSAQIK